MICERCDNALKKGAKRFCSFDDCRDASYRVHHRQECQWCKVLFECHPSKGKTQKYCSQNCANQNKSAKMTGTLRSTHISRPCVECGTIVTRYPSKMPDIVTCSRSCAWVGKSNGLFNKKTRWYKRKNGQIIKLRSKWEAAFIHDHLDKNDIDWDYEPRRFRLKDGSIYVPDFHDRTNDVWYEIKGFVFNVDPDRKTNLFRQETNYNVRLLDQNALKNMGVRLADKHLNSITKLTQTSF